MSPSKLNYYKVIVDKQFLNSNTLYDTVTLSLHGLIPPSCSMYELLKQF